MSKFCYNQKYSYVILEKPFEKIVKSHIKRMFFLSVVSGSGGRSRLAEAWCQGHSALSVQPDSLYISHTVLGLRNPENVPAQKAGITVKSFKQIGKL